MKSFSYDIKVRGFHIDVFGHTNNARYLEFMEMARWELFDPLIEGGTLKKNNLGFVIVNINIDFKATSYANDVLTLNTEVLKFGNKSITLKHRIVNKKKDREICSADVTFVMMDLTHKKAVVLEGEVMELFQNLLA